MQLHVEWERPIPLKSGARLNLIYTADFAKVPDEPGIYILGRRWGRGKFEALYVGKANRLRGRVKGQFNNLRLMNHMKQARGGKRLVLAGRFVSRPGQRQAKCLPMIERALIRYFLAEGHDLVNKQGTRLRQHEIASSGKHPKRFIPRSLFVERTKGN